MTKKELTEEQKLSLLLKEMTSVADGLSDKLKRKEEELQKEIEDHKQTKVRHNAIYLAVREENERLKSGHAENEGGITDSAWAPD